MLLREYEQRLRLWQARFGLRDWKISLQMVDDLKNQAGAPVWGLCYRFVDNRSAEILIRTPRTPAERAEIEDTIIHELLHCMIAPLQQKNPQPASIAAEEQVVWTLSPLLAQLGSTADGQILARGISRVGAKLASGMSRSSGRTRNMDPKLAELLQKLLEMQDPEAMKEMIRVVLETMAGAGAPAGEGEMESAAETDPPMAAAPAPEAPEGDRKPYERSIAVQALVAATRAHVETPRKSKEERCRELRLPRDIADLAVKLPDAEFNDYIEQVAPMARQSGPVRQVTRGEGAGKTPVPANTPRMAREVQLAKLPHDQRTGLERAFGTKIGKPAVGHTPHGELVMSHVGNVPGGSAPASNGKGQ